MRFLSVLCFTLGIFSTWNPFVTEAKALQVGLPPQMRYNIGLQLLKQGKRMLNGTEQQVRARMEALAKDTIQRHQMLRASAQDLQDIIQKSTEPNSTIPVRTTLLKNLRRPAPGRYPIRLGRTLSTSAATKEGIGASAALIVLVTALCQIL